MKKHCDLWEKMAHAIQAVRTLVDQLKEAKHELTCECALHVDDLTSHFTVRELLMLGFKPAELLGHVCLEELERAGCLLPRCKPSLNCGTH